MRVRSSRNSLWNALAIATRSIAKFVAAGKFSSFPVALPHLFLLHRSEWPSRCCCDSVQNSSRDINAPPPRRSTFPPTSPVQCTTNIDNRLVVNVANHGDGKSRSKESQTVQTGDNKYACLLASKSLHWMHAKKKDSRREPALVSIAALIYPASNPKSTIWPSTCSA